MLTDTYTLTIRREDITGLSPGEVRDALISALITRNGFAETNEAHTTGRLDITVDRIRED